MCGIAGVSCHPGVVPDPAMLDAMARALRHRGPDGEGRLVADGAGFVHRRLSIVDLEGGAQPIRSGDAALVANGEIYNDPALRARLTDARFATGSDCEPALHLWQREGYGYARELRGMYAIGLVRHGNGRHEMALSRDPFGIKPLYVARFEGGIAFASEPEALLAAGLGRREVRPEARDELLQLQFTTGRDTIYPGIRRVLPGETLHLADGALVERRRETALSVAEADEPLDEEEALARLDSALLDSVAVHQRADVPLGLFLSGGIDSAAVLGAMARLGIRRPMAWTARFDVPGAADETERARVMARSVEASHAVLTITREMVWRALPRIVACVDDPVADYAIIPTWFLAREAARDVKVVLSGEGGDELFAGYGRYRRVMRPWWRGGRAPYRQGALAGLGVLRPGRRRGWRDGIAAAELTAGAGASRLRAVQALDVEEWLPNDLLIKLDRCLMAHGVEGRTPLLDPAVAGVAWSLPDGMRVRDKSGKWLLRRWVERHVPGVEPFAHKQGFTVPVGEWIMAEGKRLGALVAEQPCIAQVAHPERVRALFCKASSGRARRAAWHLLFYALWYRVHIEQVAGEGDVFSVLSRRDG